MTDLLVIGGGAAGLLQRKAHKIVVVSLVHLKYSNIAIRIRISSIKTKTGAERMRSVRPMRFLRVG